MNAARCALALVLLLPAGAWATRNLEPLEQFHLGDLQCLHVELEEGEPRAVVRDPDGKLTTVHMRDHMGRNYGEISGLERYAIRLEEVVPDGSGGWTINTVFVNCRE